MSAETELAIDTISLMSLVLASLPGSVSAALAGLPPRGNELQATVVPGARGDLYLAGSRIERGYRFPHRPRLPHRPRRETILSLRSGRPQRSDNAEPIEMKPRPVRPAPDLSDPTPASTDMTTTFTLTAMPGVSRAGRPPHRGESSPCGGPPVLGSGVRDARAGESRGGRGGGDQPAAVVSGPVVSAPSTARACRDRHRPGRCAQCARHSASAAEQIQPSSATRIITLSYGRGDLPPRTLE